MIRTYEVKITDSNAAPSRIYLIKAATIVGARHEALSLARDGYIGGSVVLLAHGEPVAKFTRTSLCVDEVTL